ncbi:hypothetical protein G0U13_002379, partial [Staphylococcus pseudintermedius]|nr:hypothetical protein [Staphylococcus pseudintermedius]
MTATFSDKSAPISHPIHTKSKNWVQIQKPSKPIASRVLRINTASYTALLPIHLLAFYTIEFETPEGYTPTQTGQGRVSTDSNGTSSLILVEGNDDLTIDSGFYKEPVTHKVGDKVWDDLNKDGIQDDNEPGIS